MIYIPRLIIVHHSAADSPDPQFEAINEWHLLRKFALSSLGYYVGYHAVIEKDGTVCRARLDTERDCDTLGHNFDSLSVCLAGNFDVSDPTEAQKTALAKLLSQWCNQWGIGHDKIYPHRNFASKSCYGSRLADNWAAELYLRYEVQRLAEIISKLYPPK